MTEAEWLACADPEPMTDFLGEKMSSTRKLRLFGCACCRSVWQLLTDERCRAAVETAEAFADGRVTKAELTTARQRAARVERLESRRPVQSGRERSPLAAAMAVQMVLKSIYSPPGLARTVHDAGHFALVADTMERSAKTPNQAHQCDLIRCIFGNPFRPVAAGPAWLTSTVRALADGIYTDRAFDRLPILADALQDAGCDHADILDHCRGPGPHVRGCWVVDLVLGKE